MRPREAGEVHLGRVLIGTAYAAPGAERGGGLVHRRRDGAAAAVHVPLLDAQGPVKRGSLGLQGAPLAVVVGKVQQGARDLRVVLSVPPFGRAHYALLVPSA